MAKKGLKFLGLKEPMGIFKLDSNSRIPPWVTKGSLFSITRTSDELSIVCPEKNIPSRVKSEKGWRVLKVAGPLNFSEVGILAAISTTLASKRISIFVISTNDTDYILVKEQAFKKAMLALDNAGYEVLVE